MRRRLAWLALVLGALASPVGVFYFRNRDVPPDLSRLAELRKQHHLLHERLEQATAGVALLGRSEIGGGDVVVGIRTSYVNDVIREVSRRYLDRVKLDLGDIHDHEKGELKKDTFLGDVKLGDWQVQLDVDRLQGTLGAHTPELAIAPGNTVRISMPVSVREGRGQGEIKFSWSAKSLVNVVCHDFEVKESLEAVVIPAQYRMRGSFSIAAEGDEIVARPAFIRDKYRIHIDLTPESWAKVRAALDTQDTVGRCGLAMDPDQVMSQLRDLGRKGFDIRLPSSLFRPVTLPAGLHSQVDAQGTTIAVDLQSRLLRLTPETLWYGASVNGKIVSPPPPRPGASAAPTARPRT
jgi:hypothetical protein